jgi:hypothetical protein
MRRKSSDERRTPRSAGPAAAQRRLNRTLFWPRRAAAAAPRSRAPPPPPLLPLAPPTQVSDAVLTAAFQKYASFQKAKVVRYSHNGKSKGYGFVSLGDSIEGARVLREMQGKYVGERAGTCVVEGGGWRCGRVACGGGGGGWGPLLMAGQRRRGCRVGAQQPCPLRRVSAAPIRQNQSDAAPQARRSPPPAGRCRRCVAS